MTDITKGDYDVAVNSANPMTPEEYIEAVKEGWRLHNNALGRVLASGPIYDTSRDHPQLPDKRGHMINTYV